MRTVTQQWRKGATKTTKFAVSEGRAKTRQCIVVCLGNGLNQRTIPCTRLPMISAATAQQMQPQGRSRPSSNRLLWVSGARFLPQSQRPQLFGKGAPRNTARPLSGDSPHEFMSSHSNHKCCEDSRSCRYPPSLQCSSRRHVDALAPSFHT